MQRLHTVVLEATPSHLSATRLAALQESPERFERAPASHLPIANFARSPSLEASEPTRAIGVRPLQRKRSQKGRKLLDTTQARKSQLRNPEGQKRSRSSPDLIVKSLRRLGVLCSSRDFYTFGWFKHLHGLTRVEQPTSSLGYSPLASRILTCWCSGNEGMTSKKGGRTLRYPPTDFTQLVVHALIPCLSTSVEVPPPPFSRSPEGAGSFCRLIKVLAAQCPSAEASPPSPLPVARFCLFVRSFVWLRFDVFCFFCVCVRVCL